jgi:hypothetical protein
MKGGDGGTEPSSGELKTRKLSEEDEDDEEEDEDKDDDDGAGTSGGCEGTGSESTN